MPGLSTESIFLPIAGSGVATSLYASSALEASAVVKASAGNLYGFSGFNNGASDQWIQVHDAASLPADGAVPKLRVKAIAGEHFSYDPGMYPVAFSTGIVICNSSALTSKTIGSADCIFEVQYK